MKIHSTKDLNVSFLGITPVLKDATGTLGPQDIVALSGLLTFKGKSIQDLLKESVEKNENLKEKITKILKRSSLKGHASLSTTPVLCFSYEASKFLDSALTGMTFASALMASGRRTKTTIDDIFFPTSILGKAKAKEIYFRASQKNIDFSNFLLQKSIPKDEASKILQYGIYGTGIVQFPIESIVSLKKEYEIEKEWMPEEVGFLLSKIEKQLKNYGIDLLYATRQVAPRDTYPYPNIFKDPKRLNIVRSLINSKKTNSSTEIISANFLPAPGLKKQLGELKKDINTSLKNRAGIKNNWHRILLKRRQIIRDYNPAVNIKILSTVAWRIWGEKKRHRTVPMAVESIYYCLEKTIKVFNKYKNRIKNRELNDKVLKEIESVFSLPPAIKASPEFLNAWLQRALDSFFIYERLIKSGIKPRDAIFVIPRSLKIDVLQEYNLFNLIAGYFPLRLCSTVEEELRRLTIKEVLEIKKLLEAKGWGWLADHLVVKCHTVGFCLEKEFCGMIKAQIRDYDTNLHEDIHQDLEDKLQGIINTAF